MTITNPHEDTKILQLHPGIDDKNATENPTNEPDSEAQDAKIITLRRGEVAVDLWTFEWSNKTNEYVLASLHQTGNFNYLESLGYRKRYHADYSSTFLIQGDKIIAKVIAPQLRDSLKTYIEQLQGDSLRINNISATKQGLIEIFHRQQHLIINDRKLEVLSTHDRQVLRDSETTCYLPYENGIVEVKAGGIKIYTHDFLADRCVWESQVLKRSFNPKAKGEESHFAKFILNVTNSEPDRVRAFRTSIGYLLHNFVSPAEGQAVICYDQEITDAKKPDGGTGKGLFANALRQIRPVAVIDGKKFDPNDRFCFQQIDEETAVVWIDDPVVNHPRPDRRFSLERFFSQSSEGWLIEKKHQKTFRIAAKEGPKLLISSNVLMSNEGSSNVRRQFILEFSDYYKKQIKKGNEKPIQTEHNCIFFSDDWDTAEWERFDAYMIGCIAEYLQIGLQPYALHSADQNRLRQTAGEDFYLWVTTYQDKGLVLDTEYARDELYTNYKQFAGLAENQSNTRGFTNNITAYAKTQGWKYERGPNQHKVSFYLRNSEK